MTSPDDLYDVVKTGAVLTGVGGPEAVTIKMVERLTDGSASVIFAREDGTVGTTLLFADQLAGVKVARTGSRFTFDGDPVAFKLAAEARRMQMAYLFDPHSALGTSDVDPLPHQLRAVYEEMLPRHPLRYVLADDPGAGKTIMAGLLIKEMLVRGDANNVLVIAPGSLVDQWQDEMLSKFGLSFDLLTRDRVMADGNPFARGGLWIARLDMLARNSQGILDKALDAEWDLVITDEAHKCSATVWSGEVKKTARYQMMEKLGEKTRNLLLMTATPHSGKEEQFQLFMGLLDSDRFETVPREGTRHSDVSDLMRRLVKEELLRFDGTHLFPERLSYTVTYDLSGPEEKLYEAVTEYVRDQMNLAQRASGSKRVAVGFALTTLQRRLASSPRAIHRSLERRSDRLRRELDEARMGAAVGGGPLDVPGSADFDDDDLTEDELIALEEKAASASAAQTIPELETEILALERLVDMSRALVSSSSYAKWDRLRETLDPQTNTYMDDGTGNRRKVIIFTEHRDTLDDLTGRLRALLGRDEAVVNIHGGTRREDRKRAVETFRQSPECVFLVATDAAGEGVNLQNAHLLINFDLPWNPNRIEQRFGRIHRIGQREVCHMWSLVAANTREGLVYKRLLEKLEEQRGALGGRVFDVLGRVFEGKPLRELMMDAIQYGNDPAREQELLTVIDAQVGNGLATLIHEEALIVNELSGTDVEEIRREMERAEAARIQPYHVESFFKKAFEFLGGRLNPREQGRYEIRNVPAAIKERDRVVGRGAPVVDKYTRVTFDPATARIPGQAIDADLIHPGHPLMTATMSLVSERCRHALTNGATLIDRDDTSLDPYLVALLEHDITDGRSGRNGQPNVISRRAQFVRIGQDTQQQPMASTPIPNLESPTDAETAATTLLRSTDWVASSALEQAAAQVAASTLAHTHTSEVRATVTARITKARRLVTERLKAAINYYDEQTIDLRAREAAGQKTRLPASQAADRADALSRRLAARLAELDREESIYPGQPRITGAVLVIPQGWLEAQTDPEGAKAHAKETDFVERAAVDKTMAIEWFLEHTPKEMPPNNPGYDIEADTPLGLDFIEVKGRIVGADVFTITRTEMVTLKNKGERAVLALGRVQHDGSCAVRYVRDPLAGKHLDPDVTRSEFEWDAFWQRGTDMTS